MTDAGPGGGVRGSTFIGPTALQVGDHGTQHVQFVYHWKPGYRIEDFPAAARPVRARALAAQPSRLLRAGHQVVPFTGRRTDLDALARWRDEAADPLAIRLVHGPGGQGKTRLAAHFAELSRQAGWTVWQAAVNEADADPLASTPPPETGVGILLVADYAERWPTADLRQLLRGALLTRNSVPVRVLLLARPAGDWWDSLDTWIGDHLDAGASTRLLPPLAADPQARAELFQRARDRFADHLGLPTDQALCIGPPSTLDTDDDYAQVLTIHIAALAAVDARRHDDHAPTDPARASAYLLKRERSYWSELHRPPARVLSTGPTAMGRTVLTATFTRPLARDPHGWDVLHRTGLADTDAAANTLLDDHQRCYPPAHSHTVLEPLYPDRLSEDFIGLTTPPSPDDPSASHPVSGAVTDDWAHQIAQRLILGRTGTDAPAPWTRDTLTVLIETARRWPHVATGQLYPLLTKHPELALHAGGAALAALAGLDHIDVNVLEAIEPHLPTGRHADLDVGVAAITSRLARHRLATTQDPLIHARTNDALAMALSHAGLRDNALTTAQDAHAAWQRLARTTPAYESDLAASLINLGANLSEMGRRAEALTATEQAVEIYRRLAAGNPDAYESDLAASLSNLGANLSEMGRRAEALTATEQAVEIRRRLAAVDPAAYESDLALSLSNLGANLSEMGRRAETLTATEQAVEIRRRLAAVDPAAYEPDLALSLSNLGANLSRVGRRAEALTATEQAVEIHRRLAAGNPDAYEPDLAASLSNLGGDLWKLGRRAEAVTAAERAVAMYRRLAAGNPDAYEPNLAISLSSLGVQLSETGRQAEALTTTEQAVAMYRRLAAGNPDAYEPNLALSLSNLGVQLSETGRQAEALTATEQAVAIRRRLAAVDPAAYEPDLALSLSNLGDDLSKLGRWAEAMTAIERAVRMYRRLAAGNPGAYEPNLAISLYVLASVRFRGEQDLSGALRATSEAVEIYRRLIPMRSHPLLFLSPLREVLSLQVEVLIGLGRLQDAQTVRDWLAANRG
ncbi:tetratricopeptide repeat protein (plasmid) [Streptomyces sp. NBC_00464]|uniref:tetratricopeptide repeat protein n=1 Tax=Streptomyces sp. NBC_00464 TaxID=2975751 RepID=UPI002E19BE75